MTLKTLLRWLRKSLRGEYDTNGSNGNGAGPSITGILVTQTIESVRIEIQQQCKVTREKTLELNELIKKKNFNIS